MANLNQEWQLIEYPDGLPTGDHFKCVDIDEPPEETLQDGQAVFELLACSVDPYIRGLVAGEGSYTSAFTLGEPIRGFVAGKVLKSRAKNIEEGGFYTASLPFRKRQIVDTASFVRVHPTDGVPITHFLGVLGLTGLSAYLPIQKIAEPKEGETAFVSAGTGAVGSVAIQILKARGCRVIASAGADEKLDIAKELGADEVFDYKKVGDGPELEEVLRKLAPDGIDIFFDNVGGRTLEAGLACIAKHGRVILCGAISQYNNTYQQDNYGITNFSQIVRKSVRMEGFIVFNWEDEFPEAVETLTDMVKNGKLAVKETSVNGFENIPDAIIQLLNGQHVGKMIVDVQEG
ncbi:putative NADP-dependent oxidoreductase YfmJ [Diplonema papillatum]|nr:putative NADP-dependent oxidoreductase YfmJ [Diplonema papillatum]|eukprot:gene17089-26217_t